MILRQNGEEIFGEAAVVNDAENPAEVLPIPFNTTNAEIPGSKKPSRSTQRQQMPRSAIAIDAS